MFSGAKNLAVNHSPLERGLAVRTSTSNCKPDGKALVTWLLDVRGAREIGTLRSNDAPATRTSLKKLICVLSVFIAIIPCHLLCQM